MDGMFDFLRIFNYSKFSLVKRFAWLGEVYLDSEIWLKSFSDFPRYCVKQRLHFKTDNLFAMKIYS